MSSKILLTRLRKELTDLERDPPPGIVCYPVGDDITQLESFIKGPPDSPYEKGLFQLDITIPLQYPFSPPQIRFKTPIYHPNIDDCGRICADILKKGVSGGWKPSLNLSTTLMSLSTLMAHPNPDDPLDADIAKQFKMDHGLFIKTAVDHTFKYAVSSQTPVKSPDTPDPAVVGPDHEESEKEDPVVVQPKEKENNQESIVAGSGRKKMLSLSQKKKGTQPLLQPLPTPETDSCPQLTSTVPNTRKRSNAQEDIKDVSAKKSKLSLKKKKN